ncbi:MAG: hypothetical protein ABEK01_00070 [Candidatus Nanohaloarchaea archaeon]
MNRKGFVYTTFILVAVSILVVLSAMVTVSTDYTSRETPFRIGQASFYLERVEVDVPRAFSIALNRGTSAAVNYVAETGNPVSGPELAQAILNASISGYQLNETENASLYEWRSRVKEAALSSRYRLYLNYTDIDFQDSYMKVSAGMNVTSALYDPVSRARFENHPDYHQTVSIEGLEDPMLLMRSEGRYVNTFKTCSFNQPARNLVNGTQYNSGSTYGEAEVRTADSADLSQINNKSQKILVTDSVAPYVPDQLGSINQFAGLVSAQGVPTGGGGPPGGGQSGTSPGDYDTKYIFDTGTIGPVNDGMDLILYDQMVWQSNIRKMVDTGCYMNSTGPQPGPGFLERLNNELQASNGENGLQMIMNKGEIPPQLRRTDESNVGYVYWSNGGYGPVQSIAGVSGGEAYGDRQYRESFRLDQYHIQRWDLGLLAY